MMGMSYVPASSLEISEFIAFN